MRVRDLMHYLEMCDPDSEVRLATQPNWPFEYGVSQVREVTLYIEGEDGWIDPDMEHEMVVYLAEGSQLGYLPEAAKDELGW